VNAGSTPAERLAAIRAGGKPALARALAAIETDGDGAALAALLDAAASAPGGHVIGLTGPPGVGKSTLTAALLKSFRAAGESVGIIAVDPSSRLTGGALLGDRTRIRTDPADDGVFIRSMAARDRLGGLSDHAVAAIVLMRAVRDRVVVETVGVGQSEGDVAAVADTVVLCIQPGSGDSLQFMKAGVMELPDVVAVTKADTGAPARRARADVEGALSLAHAGARTPPVVLVSAADGEGLDELAAEIDAHRADAAAIAARRAAQPRAWLADAVRTRFGTHGLSTLAPDAEIAAAGGPFAAIRAVTLRLAARLRAEL
jgi:LAO/AO transport system kinase